MASHGGCKLDGEMAETTNSHNCNAVAGGDTEAAQYRPDGCASAHEGSCVRGIVTFRNGVDAFLVPNGAGTEGAVVEVTESVLLLVPAELIPAYSYFVSILARNLVKKSG
jgi:hypothetical protein